MFLVRFKLISHFTFQVQSELSTRIENLNQQINKLESENEEIKMERDDCDKMRLDCIKKHEIQLKALNQNLANLRNELKQQTDKLSQAELSINMEKSNYLELEAKYGNCLDERNELLERCVNSEKACEQMKTQNAELKHKLDDAQSALQELGREHQLLQVQNYKKNNYKWVDDSEATNCTHCKSAFSVTNRKVIL